MQVDVNVESPQQQSGLCAFGRVSRLLYCWFRSSHVPKFSRRVTRIQLTVSVSLRSTRGRTRTSACMRCEEDACIPSVECASYCATHDPVASSSFFSDFILLMLRARRPKGQITSIFASIALKPQLLKNWQLNGGTQWNMMRRDSYLKYVCT